MQNAGKPYRQETIEASQSAGSSKNAREVALELLLLRERKNGDITELLKDAFAKAGASLSVQDRSFVKQLAVGTTERLLSLDAVIDRAASVRVPAMKPTIRAVIRMGTYQILFLDSVSDWAAVDESVKLVRRRFPAKLSGFVNAVLRRIAREKERFLETVNTSDVTVRYSVPPYLADLFLRERGEEETNRMLASFLDARPLTIRPDERLLRDGERYAGWEQALTDAVGSVRHHPLVPDLLMITDPGDIRRLPGFSEGAFVVQDAAGAVAVLAAGIRPDDRVLDVCAAPGSKSLYAASLLQDASQLTARDISDEKCAILRENARRMHLSAMRIEVHDATIADPSSEGAYDVVLCDLPCTGFGVIGRKPEIRYHASKERTAELAALQKRILDTVWRYVRPGGILLYSTCTVSRAENEENTEWFTESHPFVTESWVNASLPGSVRGRVNGGCLQLIPGQDETDGFYIARMRRKEA
ncbi:MAG: 16S rRNA (cytosine(967)-C(5))-methyltransferase RsmB [Lachnospiraceae bacterium]|nr:16S rRNA (cytosine(967)-C(5))-methyltransferase RsmB [Lachnospiraceae bacterium]